MKSKNTSVAATMTAALQRSRLLICMIGVLLIAFIAASSAFANDAKTFNDAFAKANEVRKAAGAAGHEWRDTAKMLKSAQESAEAGDFKKALRLIANAQLQGEQALVQAQRESSLWQGRVVR